MNGNNHASLGLRRAFAIIGLVLAGCWFTLPPVLASEGSAPALSNIQELVVQNIRFGNNTGKSICGVRDDVLLARVVQDLKSYNLPAFSVMEAKPIKIGVARVEIVPEILSTNSQGIECTSWVSLTAQSNNTLRIPPIETPRNIIVTYWRANILVSSSENAHPQVLNDAFDKLTRKFAQQFRMDQPPPLPDIK